jgi:hypothetical protein
MSELVDRYFVVPHTHWDREWYRPLEHFRLMLGGVVDEVLDTLERDPDFTSFTLDGQAIVLEDYVAVRPGNESRLRSLIAAGRIEIGPSYVLPDEFLVCGEALVRNLLLGRAVCQRFGGRLRDRHDAVLARAGRRGRRRRHRLQLARARWDRGAGTPAPWRLQQLREHLGPR